MTYADNSQGVIHYQRESRKERKKIMIAFHPQQRARNSTVALDRDTAGGAIETHALDLLSV